MLYKHANSKPLPLRKFALFSLLATTLALTGCFSESDKKGDANSGKVGNGEVFHGAEWATIKNLDPRGEQCVQCHGKNNDMSPHTDGTMAHNIGLQKNTDNSVFASLKIQSAEVDDGEITVVLTESLPEGKNPQMTFAKLSPRVRHDRGHDWQNYLNAASNGGAKADGFVLEKGLAPQLASTSGSNPLVNISSDRKTLSFDLKNSPYNWGEHEFSVSYKTGTTGQDVGGVADFTVTGTKVLVDGISQHISCFVGNAGALQVEADSDTGDLLSSSGKLLCWWPDGTALPAGVFVSDDDEVIVSYEEDYAHRITLLLGGGSPSYNTWFDFVPSGATLDNEAYSVEINLQSDPAARDIVDIQSCNSCHDSLPLSPGIHGGGGSRSETQVCVTCHNPGNLQARTGRSVDFKQLIHRIHRGSDLPSVSGVVFNANNDNKGSDISAIENAIGGHGLLSGKATDWTKVRFPQGPTPGKAEGVTNCVKCHMGAETNRIVQELANEIGPGPDFDVQKELKLAKVTTQGDNWLNVRNIEACRGCHDSQIWMNSNESVMKTSVPLYSEAYLDIGYDWIGFKGQNAGALGGKHSSRTIGASGNQFSCGSNGGCHGNTELPDINLTNFTGNGQPDNTVKVGDNGSNKIHRRHLRLTRDYILAERFAIEVSDSQVASDGEFTARVKVLDKNTGLYLAPGDDLSASIPSLDSVTLPTGGQLAWMHNSPDYNHSPGGSSIPGNPLPVSIAWNADEGVATASLASMPRSEEWESIKDDFANLIGTVFVQGKVGTYSVQSATQDFRFDGDALAADEGRRKVVDFTAGNGVGNADSVTGWDKHDGANTQSCSSCHLQLAYHGGNRTNNVQVCVVCHNPQRTDINSRRGNLLADGQYEESLDFKRLIHAIHAAGGKDPRARGQNMRIDPLQASNANTVRPSPEGAAPKGHSFPGVLSNCKSCHIEDENTGKWTFDLEQLPEGMIGSTAITADWSMLDPAVAGTANYDPDGKRHDFDNHLKMSPIASVCSSCHDAGYKGGDDVARMNDKILDGGPYVGSHWWVMGGIAPGIVPDDGTKPSKTKHQSGL